MGSIALDHLRHDCDTNNFSCVVSMSEDRWFKEQRLAWIKESVEIFGQINRENIIAKFWISMPQASYDIAEVIKRWPELMTYNRSTKRYERNSP